MSSETSCPENPTVIDREPDGYIPGEAGSIEIWDLKCEGLYIVRYTIKPNGLLLPHYTNGDEIAVFLKGKEVTGVIIPGCSQKSNDTGKNECVVLYYFEKGDLTGRVAGTPIFNYNYGTENVIILSLLRTNGTRLRYFFLGGSQNLLNGFSNEFITQAFNVDGELATELQNKDDRGSIIYVTRGEIDLSNYPTAQEQEQKLADPSKADVFIPGAGYLNTIDAREFPFLASVGFSASYTFMYEDVMRLPHWENTNRIMYMVKGEGRIQVANDDGKNVFDDIVKEGQFLIVPEFLVMAEKAKSEMSEYLTFMTDANPISYDVSGRKSVVYGLPLAVVTNAFKISEEEAEKVKYARKEKSLAKPMQKNI
ncbi:11S globulin seed storage protein 1 [Euphorbia peplus]|nr:11S globulin seed storage protein 1 [Euphorbia peplus]